MKTPGVAPPAERPLAAKWVTLRLKSGKAVDSFWPGNAIGAQCCTRRESNTATAPRSSSSRAEQNLRTSSSGRYSEYADRYEQQAFTGHRDLHGFAPSTFTPGFLYANQYLPRS